MVKKIAEKFNRLSRVHRRHRQTDRQTDNRQTTDRQTTDGRLIAYSERNVVRSLKMVCWPIALPFPPTHKTFTTNVVAEKRYTIKPKLNILNKMSP